MEEVHHHHPYHQDLSIRSSSIKLINNNNNNNILSSSMASMASLAASVGMSIPQHHLIPSVPPSCVPQHLILSGGSHSNSHVQSQQPHPLPAVISHLCAGCGQLIKDRYLLQALDSYWHEDCLKCSCCGCRLGEVGSNLFTKANLILCKRDYLRLFGATGNCAACCKAIPAFEMVMRAKTNVYHLDCFACQQCHQRFCVGDRFYLCDNQILCEYDYEERLIFANLASSSGCQHQQQQPTQQPFGRAAAPLLPPAASPTTTQQQQQQQHSNSQRQSATEESTNITARIIWNNSTGTSPLIPSNVVADVNGEPSSSTSPDSSSTAGGHHHSAENTKQDSSSSPAGQQQQQQQQQHQVVEHDASSSGYGSPDSGGLIDEG